MGTTYNSNGSYADVSNILLGCVSGDTITIPPGTFTWSSQLVIPNTLGVTISGAGIGSSIIIRNVTDGTQLIKITSNATASTVFSGIEFQDNHVTEQTDPKSNFFDIGGDPSNAFFRITQCKFFSNPIGAGTGSPGTAIHTAIVVNDSQFGLIDNNTFLMGNNSEMIHNLGRSKGDVFGGNNILSAPPDWSNLVLQPSMLFIEYNTFTNNSLWLIGTTLYFAGNSAMQNYYGARVTFRNNVLTMSQVDVHGTGGNVAGRWFEIYSNSFNVPAAAAGKDYNQSDFMQLRGGSGVIFNNTATVGAGSSGGDLKLMEEDAGTYPLLWQIGQGQVTAGPTQTVDPLYIWNNGATIGAPQIDEQTPGTITLNRDYFYTSNSTGVKAGYNAYTNPYPWAGGGITLAFKRLGRHLKFRILTSA